LNSAKSVHHWCVLTFPVWYLYVHVARPPPIYYTVNVFISGPEPNQDMYISSGRTSVHNGPLHVLMTRHPFVIRQGLYRSYTYLHMYTQMECSARWFQPGTEWVTCMYMHVYVYACIHMHLCMHTCMYMYNMCMCPYVDVHVSIYVYAALI